jgi:hypothetical protein
MVAAVSTARSGPPVELKFELRQAPQPNQPLDVDVAVLTDVPGITHLRARFQGGAGIDIVEGADLDPVEKPPVNSVIRHVLQVLPKQDGVYALSAVLSVDTETDSLTRAYSIPIIVGTGVVQAAANAEVAEGGSAAGTGVKAR